MNQNNLYFGTERVNCKWCPYNMNSRIVITDEFHLMAIYKVTVQLAMIASPLHEDTKTN